MVLGSVVLPGTAFVEMAAWAGRQVGCDLVAELALEVPLVLPEEGGVRVQVRAGAPDAQGRREVSVHSRADAAGGPELAEERAGWVRHASGLLAATAGPAGDVAGDLASGVWPPAGAEPVPVAGFYEAGGGGRVRVRPGVPGAAGGVAARR